jgi:hypothetical protein
MYLDTKIIEEIRRTDILDFLTRHNGFTFIKRNDTYRCREHPSFAVKNDRLSWYWHSKAVGGHGCLDYLIKIENKSFKEAVSIITSTALAVIPEKPQHEAVKPKILILPEKKRLSLRVYDYLCNKRCIDMGIVHSLIQKGVLYEDKRSNVVFVGLDEHGKAKFASIRGTAGDFCGDCAGSDKRYAFTLESPYSNQLYVFESPIDTLSRASMENIFRNDKDAWKRKNYLSLSGTSDTALPFFLNKRSDLKEIVFCLDNDPPGQSAAAEMSNKYSDRHYYVRIEPPFGKDYNEDLIKLTQNMRLESRQKNPVDIHKNMSI